MLENREENRRIRDMDTSGHQESDLEDTHFRWEDTHFRWEDPDLNMDAVFRPGIDTSSSLSTVIDFEMGSMIENPILLDEEEDKENSPPTTSVSKRPTRTSALLRSRPFRTSTEKVPDYVYKKLFQWVLLCMCFLIHYN